MILISACMRAWCSISGFFCVRMQFGLAFFLAKHCISVWHVFLLVVGLGSNSGNRPQAEWQELRWSGNDSVF